MKRWISITLLALTLAPALGARDYRDLPINDGRHGYPEASKMGRIAAIAHEIDDQASYIRREFQSNNRRPDRAEARAIGTLNQLDAAAARFHDQAERSRNPRLSADELANLEQAFNSTERSLRRIDRRPYVDRGMERIYVLMNELGSYYGHQAGYYGTWGSDSDWYRHHDRDGGYRPH